MKSGLESSPTSGSGVVAVTVEAPVAEAEEEETTAAAAVKGKLVLLDKCVAEEVE